MSSSLKEVDKLVQAKKFERSLGSQGYRSGHYKLNLHTTTEDVYKRQPFVIAEAGCNHMGQMEIAKDLIETAAHFCKADAIKFQKRCPKELLTPEQYNAPHPHPENS